MPFQIIRTKANFKLEQINIVYSVEKFKLFFEIYFLKKNIMEFREARIEDRENVLKIEENAFTVSKDSFNLLSKISKKNILILRINFMWETLEKDSDGDDYMDIVFDPWVKDSNQISLVLVKNSSISGFASGFPANQTDIQNSDLPWPGWTIKLLLIKF